MSQKAFHAIWDMQRMRHGIGVRCIAALPAEQLDARPIPNMRTPKELVVHMYAFIRSAADGIKSGTLADVDQEAVRDTIRSRDQLIAYANDCWNHANTVLAGVTDAQLTGMVATPWGESYPGMAIVGMVTDEYLHHRGQLYAYLRALGSEGPMNWDFEHNAPEYQPKQTTAA